MVQVLSEFLDRVVRPGSLASVVLLVHSLAYMSSSSRSPVSDESSTRWDREKEKNPWICGSRHLTYLPRRRSAHACFFIYVAQEVNKSRSLKNMRAMKLPQTPSDLSSPTEVTTACDENTRLMMVIKNLKTRSSA